MRQAVLGSAVGAILVLALTGWRSPGNSVLAQHVRATPPQEGEVQALHWTVDGKQLEMLVLVDPKRKVMSVYHLDRASGAITLKSVRQCEWDLQLRGFNEVRPFAEEIRGMAVPR